MEIGRTAFCNRIQIPQLFFFSLLSEFQIIVSKNRSLFHALFVVVLFTIYLFLDSRLYCSSKQSYTFNLLSLSSPDRMARHNSKRQLRSIFGASPWRSNLWAGIHQVWRLSMGLNAKLRSSLLIYRFRHGSHSVEITLSNSLFVDARENSVHKRSTLGVNQRIPRSPAVKVSLSAACNLCCSVFNF